jgi:hypothetical protein
MAALYRHDDKDGVKADTITSNAIVGCRASGAIWCVPELMRVRALCLAARGERKEATSLVSNALDSAHAQGALAWELRLASTLVDIDDNEVAKTRFSQVFGCVPEGFGTRDYRDAAVKLGQSTCT